MKYEEQKNRTMKTFEEIYRDAAVRNGCNAGKTFARVMFEEGMSQNLERCMDRAAGSHTDLMAFAGWFGKRLARESVRCCSARGNINLSYFLVLLPGHLIDYVLLHELAHTREMNHGEHFWKLLDSMTGNKAQDFRNRRKTGCTVPAVD